MSFSDISDEQAAEIALQTIRREAEAVSCLGEQLRADLPRIARQLLACRGHVLVTGAGTSAAVARRFAHLLSCAGIPALYLDASECLHGGSGTITERDIVFVISKGGKSAEVNEVATIARERGAIVVAQTESLTSPLAGISHEILHIEAPREVDLFDGLMALGSSLVACAVGDALCAVLLAMRRYTLEEFGRTHPGGAVGEAIRQRQRNADTEVAS